MSHLEIEPDRPVDVHRTLAVHRRGHADPTLRFEPDGTIWRATRLPAGAALVRLRQVGSRIEADAWGPAAEAAIGRVPALIGLEDEPDALRPRHELLRQLIRRFAGVRIGRTGSVMEALVPAILEQKVTGEQARRGFRSLLRRFGDPAPRPPDGEGPALILPMDPGVLARLAYYQLHPFDVERRRADTLLRAALVADRIERIVDVPLHDAYARLRSLPGVGPWTAAEVGLRALGDPDAVSVGDFHTPDLVAWALAGEARADDTRMLELLEPYRGQRGRVVRLLELSGVRPPAFGPRVAPRVIASD